MTPEGRLTLALALLTVIAAGDPASAAPVGALKQFKVPTANSEPRAIANGSDGNRWFTEGTEFTNAPPRLARITPSGEIIEFDANCQECILTDVAQGPADVLYLTSNDPTLLRFDRATGAFLAPVVATIVQAKFGFHPAFAVAAVGMVISVSILWRYKSHLEGAEKPVGGKVTESQKAETERPKQAIDLVPDWKRMTWAYDALPADDPARATEPLA